MFTWIRNAKNPGMARLTMYSYACPSKRLLSRFRGIESNAPHQFYLAADTVPSRSGYTLEHDYSSELPDAKETTLIILVWLAIPSTITKWTTARIHFKTKTNERQLNVYDIFQVKHVPSLLIFEHTRAVRPLFRDTSEHYCNRIELKFLGFTTTFVARAHTSDLLLLLIQLFPQRIDILKKSELWCSKWLRNALSSRTGWLSSCTSRFNFLEMQSMPLELLRRNSFCILYKTSRTLSSRHTICCSGQVWVLLPL